MGEVAQAALQAPQAADAAAEAETGDWRAALVLAGAEKEKEEEIKAKNFYLLYLNDYRRCELKQKRKRYSSSRFFFRRKYYSVKVCVRRTFAFNMTRFSNFPTFNAKKHTNLKQLFSGKFM